MAAAQATENHGDEWDLTWYFQWGIYVNSNLNPLTKFTSNSRSMEFKDNLPWNISQMIRKTIPISMRIVISNAMKQSIPVWIWWKVNENWEKITWSEFINKGKAILEKILASQEINKSEGAGLWESQSGVWVGKLTIWVRLFEVEKL